MCSRYFLMDRSLKSMYEMEGYDTSIYHKLHLFLRILYSSENSRIKCVLNHFRHSSPKQVTPKKGFPLEKRGPCTSARKSHLPFLQVGKITSPVRVLMVKEEELVVELRHLWPQVGFGAVWL